MTNNLNCNSWTEGCDGKLELWSDTEGGYFQVCKKCDSIYELGGCPREWIFTK